MLPFLKYALPAVIVLGILGFVVFFIFSRNIQPSQTESPEPVLTNTQASPLASYIPIQGLKQLSIPLSGTNPGQARLTQILNETLLNIEISGSVPGEAYPAFIYSGFCANLGDQTQVLSRVKEGISKTVVQSTIDAILTDKPLAIAVSRIGDKSIDIISCGEIK